jgi:hypothetical protein
MSIFAGSTEVKSIKVGATDVKAVYAGDEKVWPTFSYPETALVITPIEEDIHESGRAYVNVLKMSDRWFIDYGLNLHDVAGSNAAGKIQKFSVKQVPSSTTLDCTLVGRGGIQTRGSRVYAGGAGGEVVLQNGISGLKSGAQFEFSGAGDSSNPNGKGTALAISGLSTTDVNIKSGYGGDAVNASGGTLFKANGGEVAGNATQGGGAGASEKPVAGSAGDIGVSIPVYGAVGMGGTKLSSSNTEPRYIQAGKGRDAYQQDGFTTDKGGIGGALIEVKGVSEIIIEGRDYIEIPELPETPSHSYAGRVIYSFGQPFDGTGQFYTERGAPISACSMERGDIHIMVAGLMGGPSVYDPIWDFGFGTAGSHRFRAGDTYFGDKTKLSVGLAIAQSNFAAPTHFITDRATISSYPQDFLAYAWKIPHAVLGDPDEGSLTSSDASITTPIEITDGIPNGIAIVVYGAMSINNSNISLNGLIHTQGGASSGNNYKLYGGYKYVRLDQNGSYSESEDATIDYSRGYSERLFVYRRKT